MISFDVFLRKLVELCCCSPCCAQKPQDPEPESLPTIFVPKMFGTKMVTPLI